MSRLHRGDITTLRPIRCAVLTSHTDRGRAPGLSVADGLAGLAVAGLMLPEAVAYAAIAGLPPARAIVAAIAGGLGYVLIGRSRFAMVAPTSSSAAILAAALATLGAPADTRAMLATAIVVLVSLLFVAMATLRMGSLAAFVSPPVLRGFAFGLAVTIIVKQLPMLLGLPVRGGNIALLSWAIVTHIAEANTASTMIGLGSLAIAILSRGRSKLPGALLMLVAGTILSLAFDLPAEGVRLVGAISIHLDVPRLPVLGFGDWARLLQLAAPLTLILFAESWGTMRSLGLQHSEALSADRELFALGSANLLSACAQGMPVGAGFSAGSASETAGARTRMTAVTAILGLAAMVLLAGPAISHIPEPVLAAVVIAALMHALALAPFVRLFRIDRDQWIALAAGVGVLALGVLNGMLFAIAISLAALLRRLSRPVVSELGRLGHGHDYVDLAIHHDSEAVPGVFIYRPNAPLFFANAADTLGTIARRCATIPRGTTVVLSLEESDDLDSGALDALAGLSSTLQASGHRLRLARVHDRVHDVLIAAGLDSLAAEAQFSVADAVNATLFEPENAHAPQS